MSTIDDVARVAGVSKSTVSRFLSGNGYVSGRAVGLVQQAMEQLDYYPNKFAQGLAGNRADGIGVVIQDFAEPYFGMVLRGIEGTVKQRHLQITVASANRSPHDELKAIKFLRQQRYNVIILTTSVLTGSRLLELAGQGTEFVHIGHYLPKLAGRCIYLDDIKGAEMATAYLISQGHTRIAYLAFPEFDEYLDARLYGYRAALEKAGLPYAERLVVKPESFDQTSALRATERLLERVEPFTAIFAATDLLAIGAYKALRQAGLRVPDDVSLVGYDDIDVASFLEPPLTTIKQPIQEMSMAAARLAIRYLEGTAADEEVNHEFMPSLVVRESVKSVS